ncbi:MAG: TerB family tellurite resistance protein [Gammaproteobacteria bacterium]|nr:TerB family tellurite resistance protein [Gammaproteobacteria bacterium]
MINTIRQFFDQHILTDGSGGDGDDFEHRQRLATAALLIEMTRADFSVTDAEQQALVKTVRRIYGLNEEETHELVRLAGEELDNATSLYQFTTLINQNFSPAQKRHVVELLWEMAYADGTLNKYEEHLVRKVADLIYVSHAVFIQTKHQTRKKMRI